MGGDPGAGAGAEEAGAAGLVSTWDAGAARPSVTPPDLVGAEK